MLLLSRDTGTTIIGTENRIKPTHLWSGYFDTLVNLISGSFNPLDR